MYNSLELFFGAGGLALGLAAAGFRHRQNKHKPLTQEQNTENRCTETLDGSALIRRILVSPPSAVESLATRRAVFTSAAPLLPKPPVSTVPGAGAQ